MGSNRRYPNLKRGYTVEIESDAGPSEIIISGEPELGEARKLYELACTNNPDRKVILRHGARVIERSCGPR